MYQRATPIKNKNTTKTPTTRSDDILQKNYKRFIVLSLLLIGAIWVVRPSFFSFLSFSSFSSAAPAAAAAPVKMTGGGGGGGAQLRLDTLEILRKFN